MLIFPLGHVNCGSCVDNPNCTCICHSEDITDSRHKEIHREFGLIGKVDEPYDLDNLPKDFKRY